jgi:hypothetical protein
MFTFDRDTATIAAIIVCIAATAYLYRELKKIREDFTVALAEQKEPEPPVTVVQPAPVQQAPKVMTTRKKASTPAPSETESSE